MLLSYYKKNRIFLNRLLKSYYDLNDRHSFNIDPDVDAK